MHMAFRAVPLWCEHMPLTRGALPPMALRSAHARACTQGLSPGALRYLLALKREDLEKDDQARLEQLLKLCPKV